MTVTTIPMPLFTIILTLNTNNLVHVTSVVENSTLYENERFVIVCGKQEVSVVIDGYEVYVIEGKGCLSVPKFSENYTLQNNTLIFNRLGLRRTTLYSTQATYVNIYAVNDFDINKLVALLVLLAETIRRLSALEYEG